MKNLDEILKASGLDFDILKVPFVGQFEGVNDSGDLVPEYVKSDYYGLWNTKTNEFINSVKGSYTISQNREIVDMVMKGMKPFGDDIEIQKAGSLNGGRKVFMQLAVKGYSKVGDDQIKRYVTIIDSNDGSTGLSVGIGDLTMSCQNQFYQFYKAGQHKFRHTISIEEKIKMLPSMIETALSESLRMVELYNKMASTPLTKGLVDKLVQTILKTDRSVEKEELENLSTRVRNAMDSLYGNIQTEMAQKGKNIWGLHSGVTRWTTHEKSAPRRENGRLESSMIGTNYKTNQQSLEFALAHI
jgi:hypothetical protein